MSKAVIKLYRDVPRARKALQQLLSSGFAPADLSLVAGPQHMGKITEVEGAPVSKGKMSGVEVSISGPLARELKDGAVEQTLVEYLGVSEDVLGYYQFGVANGGVVVAVTGDDNKLDGARSALRDAEAMAPEKTKPAGFESAKRMTESNPADAKMTGDFRRY